MSRECSSPRRSRAQLWAPGPKLRRGRQTSFHRIPVDVPQLLRVLAFRVDVVRAASNPTLSQKTNPRKGRAPTVSWKLEKPGNAGPPRQPFSVRLRDGAW